MRRHHAGIEVVAAAGREADIEADGLALVEVRHRVGRRPVHASSTSAAQAQANRCNMHGRLMPRPQSFSSFFAVPLSTIALAFASKPKLVDDVEAALLECDQLGESVPKIKRSAPTVLIAHSIAGA